MDNGGVPGRGDVHPTKSKEIEESGGPDANIWKHGEIPTDLGWTIIVLIPKGNTDTHG